MDRIINCDALEALQGLPDQSVQACVTSPPYWGLRDYGNSGQIGLEKTPEEFVQKLVAIFSEVRRVLRNDGTLWLNLGDSYAATKVGNTNGTYGKVKQKAGVNEDKRVRTIPPGLKQKDLVGIPWRVAFALQADGWYLRQDLIWAKPNPMPESVTDRCTKAHEYIFLLSKSPKYYFDNDAIKEPSKYPDDNRKGRQKLSDYVAQTSELGQLRAVINPKGARTYPTRNRRSVWTIATKPFKGAHFATFPRDLVEPCILAGTPVGGVVLDPFLGSGTTAVVAKQLKRNYIGIEINEKYCEIARNRLSQEMLF